VFLADCIFTLGLCGGFRVGIRLLYMQQRTLFNLVTKDERDDDHDGKAPPVRLLIIGAGDAASAIIREIQGNARSPYKVVVCVDDDPNKQGYTLLGVTIGGPISDLPEFAESFKAAEIIIALPSVSGDRMRHIVNVCKRTSLPFKTLPSFSSMIDGRVTVNDLREVNYEDLLGRPPVRLDVREIGQYITGKTVAVTGAGGSIGTELCRQIVRFKPAALILVEASEFNLYQIEQTLRIEHRFKDLYPAMGRVQDHALMVRIFDKYRPGVVFHAAACKHVPMVEINPWEAVFNNVIGGRVIMDVSDAYGVERCVMVSTDKAVRPTSVMGASKRAIEIILQSRPPTHTRFMAVRFGNVVGSSGSAVPHFQSQIRAGGPVTVTDPEMTRYFMTIPEASQLILQAGAMGEGGEIFILEMGTPIKIADMARDLIRLSGKEPDTDIKIVYTGLRPGEKLYEELITRGEGIVPTGHEKIMVLRSDRTSADLAAHHHQVRAQVNELIMAAQSYDGARVKSLLKQLVPEYTPSDIAGFL
jgi:FlaA1/EpsC-like NDP-sugar epimerase